MTTFRQFDTKRKVISKANFDALDKSTLEVGEEYDIVGEIEKEDLSSDIQASLDKADNSFNTPTNDSTATAGQVLTKTADGSEWKDTEAVSQEQSDLATTDESSAAFVKNKKTSNLTNDGDGTSPFATQSWVGTNGGKIDTISLNGANVPADENKNIDITITKADVGLDKVTNAAMDPMPITGSSNYVTSGGVKSYLDSAVAGINTTVGVAQQAAEAAQTAIDTHKADKTNPHGVTKAQVGLSNVDNTSDEDKPVSTATATELAKKQDELTAAQLNAANSGVTAAKVSSYDSHIANKSNPHAVTKSQVGLGNVDNTADKDKPVSTAQQTEIDKKLDKTGGTISGDLTITDSLTVGEENITDSIATAKQAADDAMGLAQRLDNDVAGLQLDKLDKPTNDASATAGQVLTKTANGSEWKDNDGNIVIKKTVPTFPESGGSNIIINFTTEEQNAIKTTPEKVVLEIATTTETKVLSPSSITSANIYFSTSVRFDTYYYLVYITSANKGQFGRYDIETGGGGETYVCFVQTTDEVGLSSGDLNALTDDNNDNVIILEYNADEGTHTTYRRCLSGGGNMYWFVSVFTDSDIPPASANNFYVGIKARVVKRSDSTLSETYSTSLTTKAQLGTVNKATRKYEHRILSKVMLKGSLYTVEVNIITSDANAYTTTVPTRLEKGYPCIVSIGTGSETVSNVMVGYYSSSGEIQLRGILIDIIGDTSVIGSATTFSTVTFIASDTVTQI